MFGSKKPFAVSESVGHPVVVADLEVLARVAGGAGPRGGWSVTVADGARSQPLIESLGTSTVTALGPRGGW